MGRGSGGDGRTSGEVAFWNDALAARAVYDIPLFFVASDSKSTSSISTKPL